MSILDEYFPRTDNFTPSFNQPHCTNWPSVEERIREVLDEFTDCQGYIPQDNFTKKRWIAGARDFVEAIGESPRLLRAAWEFYLDIDFERRQKIIISTPRSLIEMARKCRDNKREDPDSPEVIERKALSWLDDDERREWWK